MKPLSHSLLCLGSLCTESITRLLKQRSRYALCQTLLYAKLHAHTCTRTHLALWKRNVLLTTNHTQEDWSNYDKNCGFNLSVPVPSLTKSLSPLMISGGFLPSIWTEKTSFCPSLRRWSFAELLCTIPVRFPGKHPGSLPESHIMLSGEKRGFQPQDYSYLNFLVYSPTCMMQKSTSNSYFKE